MKTLSVVLLGLLSLNVYAGNLPTPSDSWNTILANDSVVVDQTAFAQKFGSQGFLNACVSGNELHSIQPIKRCADYEDVTVYRSGGEGDGGPINQVVCAKYEYQNVVLPLHQIVDTTCAKWNYIHVPGAEGDARTDMTCARYNTAAYDLSTSPKFSVYGYEWTPGTEGNTTYQPTKFLFKKAYNIPSCQ